MGTVYEEQFIKDWRDGKKSDLGMQVGGFENRGIYWGLIGDFCHRWGSARNILASLQLLLSIKSEYFQF